MKTAVRNHQKNGLSRVDSGCVDVEAVTDIIEWVRSQRDSASLSKAINTFNETGKLDGIYRTLITYRQAHFSGSGYTPCGNNACSNALYQANDDTLFRITAGLINVMATKSARFTSDKSEMKANSASILNEALSKFLFQADPQRTDNFVALLRTVLSRALSDAGGEFEGSVQNQQIATIAGARRATLRQELDRDPSENEVRISTQNWVIANQISTTTGAEQSINLYTASDEQIQAYILRTTPEKLRLARRYLSKNSTLAALADEAIFMFSIGSSNLSIDSLAINGETNSELSRYEVGRIEHISLAECLVGLASGDVEELGDQILEQLYSDSDLIAKRVSAERMASPLAQYSWLSIADDPSMLA